MKRNVTYALLLGGLLLTSMTLTAQLRNVHPVTAEGEYQAPVWSPDGEKLLFDVLPKYWTAEELS